jgi:uncharacterized coiled-coil protein SlyX
MSTLSAELAQWFLGVAGATTVLVFVGRKLVEQLFIRDVERFKSDLQRETAVEVERLRSQLAQERYEHETRFRWLHGRRADAIAGVHQAVIRAIGATSTAAEGIISQHSLGLRFPQMLDTSIAEMRSRIQELNDAFRAQRVFLPERLNQLVSPILNQLRDIDNSAGYAHFHLKPPLGEFNQETLDGAVTRLQHAMVGLEDSEDQLLREMRSAFNQAEDDVDDPA